MIALMAKIFSIFTKNAKGVIYFLELSLKAVDFVLLSPCFIKRLTDDSISMALMPPIVPEARSVCSKQPEKYDEGQRKAPPICGISGHPHWANMTIDIDTDWGKSCKGFTDLPGGLRVGYVPDIKF